MINKKKTKRSTTCSSKGDRNTSQENKSKVTLKNSNNESINVDFKNGSPVLNIHIHVPSTNISDSSVHLPQIQPIIHLHFDEIATRLGILKNEKCEETLNKVFENFASPRFGDVMLHFKNKSDKVNNEELNKSNKAACSKRCSTDSQLNGGRKKKRKESNASENSKVVETMKHLTDEKNTSEKNSKDCSDTTLLSKYKDLNIKNAVVLLTDICKSKTWKNFIPPAVNNCGKPETDFESLDDSLVHIENNHDGDAENGKCSIKQENNFLASLSLSPVKNLNKSHGFENDCSEVKEEKLVVNTLSPQGSVVNGKNLTALVEGCTFSEILSSFKQRYNQYLVDTAKSHKDNKTDDKSRSEVNSVCFSEANNDKVSFEEKPEIHEESDIDGKNVISTNTLDSKSDELLQEISDFDVKSEKSEPLSDKETAEGNGWECTFMESYDTDSKSDQLENEIYKSHLSPKEKSVDSETEHKSSTVKVEGNFEVSETKYSNVIDVGHVDFHLHLIKKEMHRRSQMAPKKKKKANVGKRADIFIAKTDPLSPPKKIKHSNESPRKKASSSSPTKDYIPLNTSGPTKFAVAPLDEINPYKTHSARNFKQEMLFGNRVQRFSKPDQLKILKLKQEARLGRSSVIE